MKEKILVSACLMGRPTRYDGRSVEYPDVSRLSEKYDIVEVCPEVAGGLPTPRVPSERVGHAVMMRDGRDATREFLSGARRAYELCALHNIKIAVLKEKSPSCGAGRIYDGSFTGRLTDGFGVTAEYLISRGIEVYGESRISELLKKGENENV